MKTNSNFSRHAVWVTGALLLVSAAAHAQVAAQYAAPILRISPYARATAMGEAFTALAYDLNVLRYNIGGLGNMKSNSLAAHFHPWIEDTYQGALDGALRTRYGVFGANITYFSEGELAEINEDFKPTLNTFNNNNAALTLGYGNYINLFNYPFSFGFAGKVIRQDLAGDVGYGVGADVGVLFKHPYFSVGLTLQNFTLSKLQLNPQANSFRLPETMRGGLGTSLQLMPQLRWSVGVDAAKFLDNADKDVRFYGGTEFRISDVLALRGGYKLHDDEVSRWGAGFGVIIPMAWAGGSSTELDYAYSPLENFDSQAHRFSISFNFGRVAPMGVLATGEAQRELEAARRAREEAEEARLAALEAEGRLRDVEDRMSKLEEEMAKKFEEIKKIAESTKGDITVKQVEGGNVQATLRNVNFDFDKYEIRPDMYDTMNKLAEILNTYADSQVWISGHTDSIGTDEYNFHLAERRMNSVMDYLGRRNVTPGRFVAPIPYGEWRPLVSNSTDEGRFLNRRVEFVIYTGENKPGLHPGSMIETVAVRNDSILVIGNGELVFSQKLLDEPPRALLIFPKVYIPDAKTIPINKGNVQQARLGFHPEDGSTWVVLDLYAPVPPQSMALGRTVRILPEPPSSSATKEPNQ